MKEELVGLDLYQSHKEALRVNEHWQRYLHMIGDRGRVVSASLNDFSKEVCEMQVKVGQFTAFLKETPFITAYGYWLKEVRSMDKFLQETYLRASEFLKEKNLIPVVDSQGNLLTLDEFRRVGHRTILENIRCVSDCAVLQKETTVQYYIKFSQSLARSTCNFIPPGFDPDRNLVKNKRIKYDDFLDFVQKLPERDALIAKLLYFGAPSMESVLSLKTAAIHPEESYISFSEGEVVLPKHLICDLIAFIRNKKGQHDLVFTNVRGFEVERAHLNQSFSRACEKISSNVKITPGLLLRLEGEEKFSG